MSAGATSTLLDSVRSLMEAATRSYAGVPPAAARLQAVIDRLDEPLRVAIAGKVKAGKSTLLNALVGEELAPTDAGGAPAPAVAHAGAAAGCPQRSGVRRDLRGAQLIEGVDRRAPQRAGKSSSCAYFVSTYSRTEASLPSRRRNAKW
jgi:ATPase subunit of ABC transporter with duplicated ATPase domains